MGILAAHREFLGEIGVLDGGMHIYGGENVELGLRVSLIYFSAYKTSYINVACDFQSSSACSIWNYIPP